MNPMDKVIEILLLRYFKGSRTMIVNICSLIVALSALSFYPGLLAGPYAAVALAVVSIANAVLRFDTNTPVFKKKKKTEVQ